MLRRPPPGLSLLGVAAVLGCGSSKGDATAVPDAATAAPSCGAGMVTDPADGKCKPDGTTTHVGVRCATTGTDPACGTHLSSTCNDEANDSFPGGYCSFEPCSQNVLCPRGSTCAGLAGEKPACFSICSKDVDCRTPDYRCWDVAGFFVSGASHKVCYLAAWPCTKDLECPPDAPRCNLGGASDGGMPPDNEGTCGATGPGSNGGAGGVDEPDASAISGGPGDAASVAAPDGSSGGEVCAGYRGNGIQPGVSAAAFCGLWGTVCAFGPGPGKYGSEQDCESKYGATLPVNQSCRAARLCDARDTSSVTLRAEHCGYATGMTQCM